jgi:hypothetical protein
MAKVKIQGNASGTGVLTVTAPNTSTDRTITLPDATGTLTFTPGITDNSNATAITIDSSENVGIGVTPPAYGAGYTGLSVGAVGTILANTSGLDGMYLASNAYYGAGYKYIQNGKALELKMDAGGGNFKFRTAASGTAGGAITWSDRLEIKADGRGLSQFTAKAWVNFNGTVAAASMIRDSHNVSSITDNGTGNYTVNFSSAMANTSYSVHGTVGGDTGNGSLHAFEVHVNGYSTSSSKVLSAYVATSSANRTQYDESYMNVLYFGD